MRSWVRRMFVSSASTVSRYWLSCTVMAYMKMVELPVGSTGQKVVAAASARAESCRLSRAKNVMESQLKVSEMSSISLSAHGQERKISVPAPR